MSTLSMGQDDPWVRFGRVRIFVNNSRLGGENSRNLIYILQKIYVVIMTQSCAYVRWREKATPYNSQPSRLQFSRNVQNSQPSRLQNNRHVYKTIVMSTIQPSCLEFTAVTSTKQVVNCRHDDCIVDVTVVL